tara:strand:- start:879 stop:1004 length:126 start_codon:yes stop_codon:yes gene_type:complete
MAKPADRSPIIKGRPGSLLNRVDNKKLNTEAEIQPTKIAVY